MDYINLMHGLNNTKIYKHQNEFCAFTSSSNEILTFETKSIEEMAKYLFKKIQEPSKIRMMFDGEFISNKKKQLLMGLIKEKYITLEIFTRWINLLNLK